MKSLAWPTLLLLGALLVCGGAAFAADGGSDSDASDEVTSIHGALTFVDQYHPAFRAPYSGTNSLNPGSRAMETVAADLYTGLRLWSGGQVYATSEIDQGFGLSDTLGIAAFPSGDAYKVGSDHPYFRLQRLFFRQEFDLGGETSPVAPGADQLGMSQTADNIIITAGKFSVVDVFDNNAFAHDPTSDFMNWAIIDAGAFDYAADSWAFTYGSSVEWTQSWWTLRGGFFALSRIPNGTAIQTDFKQFQAVGETEARFKLFDREGKLKFLGFENRGYMGSFDDAIALGLLTHTVPNVALVRKYRSRVGFAMNLEQPITDELGAFARVSFDTGNVEDYEFSDINQSLSAGLSLNGTRWNRKDDTVGLAFVVDGISNAERRYYAAGGLEPLIGDGQLPRYATENVIETYYNAQLTGWLGTTLDYQFVDHPAYNPERGPVSVIAIRLHAAF